MVIGHFGFGLGAKKFAPKVSLGTLFLAVQWADLLWPVLLLTGVEHVGLQPGNAKFPLEFSDYPITHSLLLSIAWGACFGFIYWLVKRDIRSAIVVGVCVVSHWALDLIVHQPDLPLFPGGGTKVGLGLWNWPVITAVVEFGIFIWGTALYLRTTRAKNAIGKWSLWFLIILLVVAQIAGKVSALPTSVNALGWAALYQWIFVIIGYWVDKNRQALVFEPINQLLSI